MLCQKCFKKTANISVTQVVNGQKQELHVCSACAEEMGLNKAVTNLPQIFTGLMLDILKHKEQQAGLPVRYSGTTHCPFCRYSWQDFERTGLLGCPMCYSTFYEKIKKVLKNIHGTARHIGQRPDEERTVPGEANLSLLEKALQEAIEKEEYEKAAEIRDKIRSLKQRLGRKE
jgi:protein arginine kinase activator